MGFSILNTTSCQQLVFSKNVTVVQGLVPSIERWETLVLVLGFGTFATIVALVFSFVRKRVYKDKVGHALISLL